MKWHNGTWIYYEFKIVSCTIAYLPKKIGYLIAHFVADIIYLLSPALRAAVADNMKHVLGAAVDKAALKQAVRGVFRNAAKNYFDLVKVPHMKLAEIEQSITVHGWDNFEAALNRGKGVIVITAHLGSFDMAAQMIAARSVKAMVLIEPLEPKPLLDYIINVRGSKGVAIVPLQFGALKVVLQSLRRGEVVLLACDRDIGNDGLKAPFFGRETRIPAGAARLAMRTGAAVVPAFNLRHSDGRYVIFIEPALEITPSGNDALANNMRKIVAVMEKYIRLSPEQWVVLRPVWRNEH